MSVGPASSRLYSDALMMEIATNPKCNDCLETLTSIFPRLSLSADPSREDKKSISYKELKAILQPLTAEVARIAFRNDSLHNLNGYARSLQMIVGDRLPSTAGSKEALLNYHIPKRLLKSAIDRFLQTKMDTPVSTSHDFALAMQKSFSGTFDSKTVKDIFLRNTMMANDVECSHDDDDTEEAFMRIREVVMANDGARSPAARSLSPASDTFSYASGDEDDADQMSDRYNMFSITR